MCYISWSLGAVRDAMYATLETTEISRMKDLTVSKASFGVRP